MQAVHEGQLRGAFRGFKNRDTVFEFVDGSKWRQHEYMYQYYYAYMPDAKIIEDAGVLHIEVDGMNDSVEVVPIR